jgi:DNA gyrase subunit A
MITRDGVTKKVSLPLFVNARKRGIAAINLDEGDVLINCVLVNEDDEAMIITRKGKALRVAGKAIRAMGRPARGVRGIRLVGKDVVVGLMKVDDAKKMLLVTEQGQGKQVEFSEFRPHGRGTMGQKIYTFRNKTGYLVSALAVDDNDDLVCITSMGQSIRVPVESIATQKAYASGVSVTRLRENDIIVAIAKTESEKDEEEEAQQK